MWIFLVAGYKAWVCSWAFVELETTVLSRLLSHKWFKRAVWNCDQEKKNRRGVILLQHYPVPCQTPSIVSVGFLTFSHSQGLYATSCYWGSSDTISIRTQPDLKRSYIWNTYSCKTSKLCDICFLKWAHVKLMRPTLLNNALELTPYNLLIVDSINQCYQPAM